MTYFFTIKEDTRKFYLNNYRLDITTMWCPGMQKKFKSEIVVEKVGVKMFTKYQKA